MNIEQADTSAGSEVEQTLRNGPIEYARVIEIFMDNETKYYSELFHEISFTDNEGEKTYAPMGPRIIPPDQVTEDLSLDEATISIFFDSARAADNSDFVGELVDANIIQRRVRIRTILFRPNTNKAVAIWVFNQQDGVVDTFRDRLSVDDRPLIEMSISSGSFAYLERRNSTLTPVVQRELHPGDTSLDHIAALVDVELPWGE